MKKIFIDTVCVGSEDDLVVISIGLISDCGRTFYAEFNDYVHISGLPISVTKNLKYGGFFQKLEQSGDDIYYKSIRSNIGDRMSNWLDKFGMVEICYNDLNNWVLFSEILDDSFNYPKNIADLYFDLDVSFDGCALTKATKLKSLIDG